MNQSLDTRASSRPRPVTSMARHIRPYTRDIRCFTALSPVTRAAPNSPIPAITLLLQPILHNTLSYFFPSLCSFYPSFFFFFLSPARNASSSVGL